MNATFAWDVLTDVQFFTPTIGSATIAYITFADPNANLAGRATWQTSGTGAGCRIVLANAGLNTVHFDGQPGLVTLGEKQCIFAHELGHTMGIAHSNNAADHDTPQGAHAAGESIMRGGEHAARCHNGAPPGAPRNADIADANFKY